MKKEYIVSYAHVEEVYYEQSVHAESEEEAIEKVKGNEECHNEVGVQGIEFKDYRIESEDEI